MLLQQIMLRTATRTIIDRRVSTVLSTLAPSARTAPLTTARGLSISSTAAMTTPPTKLSIQIISDNICPFCYLGKKKLEAAVARLPAGSVEVSYDWRAFELDSTLPLDGVDKMTRYRQKFGAGRIEGMVAMMKNNGRPYGIEFDYGGKVGNTVNSHRLVEFSKSDSQGGGKLTDDLINVLFKSYFEQQGDISDIDTLVRIGVEAKLPASEAELRTFLKGDGLRKEVLAEIEDARNAEISGVPFFILNGKYTVSGAQEPEVFLDIFKKIGVKTTESAGTAQTNSAAQC
jgi:predicted DsbA family dithiol-disulfide isomerase